MANEPLADPKFEIGHVLFIDIVGYSKLLIGQQSELVRQLKEIVARTEQVRSDFAPRRSKTLVPISFR